MYGSAGLHLDINAVVDTGFNGYLCLPGSAIAALQLSFAADSVASLADGSKKKFRIFTAEVFWVGGPLQIPVWEVGDECLIGMDLLTDCEMRVQVRPGGLVEIRPIP